MKLFLIFVIILVGTLVITPAYAASYSYPSISYRFSEPPTYCFQQPLEESGHTLSQYEYIVIDAVRTWDYALSKYAKSNGLDRDVWELDQKIIPYNGDLSDCTILIIFIKATASPYTYNTETGRETRAAGHFCVLDIHVGQCTQEEIDEIVVWYELMSEAYMRKVLIHEIGHSMGLGHYVSHDNDVNGKLWNCSIKAPSLMVASPCLKEIEQIDVELVISNYGTEKGFYEFASEDPEIIENESTVNKGIIFVKPKPIVKPFESIEISEQEISLSKYEPKLIKIHGQIKEAEFFKGTFVVLTVKYPDDPVVLHKVRVSSSGYFELPLMLDTKTYSDGIYHVSSSYRENADHSMFFEFSINTPIAFTKERETSKTSSSTFETFDRMNSVFEDRMLWLEKNNLLLDEISEYDNSGLYAASSYKEKSTLLLEKFLIFQNVAKLKIENNDDTITPTLEKMNELLSEAENELVDYTKILNDKKEILNENLVPDWIKNNAGWWAEGQIDDSAFVQGIEFMIKENIISLPDMPKSSYMTEQTTHTIPDWIKNNAGWWAEGQIDDSAFVQGIEFLVKSGIIQVR